MQSIKISQILYLQKDSSIITEPNLSVNHFQGFFFPQMKYLKYIICKLWSMRSKSLHFLSQVQRQMETYLKGVLGGGGKQESGGRG